MYVNIKTQKKKKLKTQKIVADLKVYSERGIRISRFLSCPGSYIYENQGSLGSFFPKKKYKKFKFSPRVAFTEFQVSIVFWWGAKTHTDTYTSPNMETLMPAPRGFDFIYSCQCMDRFKVWRIYRLWFLNSIIGNLRVTYKSTVEYLPFLIEVKSVFSCFLKFLIPTDAHNDMAS